MGCAASVHDGQNPPSPNPGGNPPPSGNQYSNGTGAGVTLVQSRSAINKAVAEANGTQMTFREKSRASMDAARTSLDAVSMGSSSARGITKLESLNERSSPQEVLTKLLEGNERFLSGEKANPHQDFERLAQLTDHQKPLVAILGCADSRVPPEIAFDQGFGDMFTCRVAGNIATAEEIASLEYAVLQLQVKVVMVMGHSSCGAVKAALSGKAFPGFIDTLVDHLDVAIARVDALTAEEIAGARMGKQEMLDKVVAENVRYQIERCKRSTIIAEALNKGRLLLVGSVYDLDSGRVSLLQPKPSRRSVDLGH